MIQGKIAYLVMTERDNELLQTSHYVITRLVKAMKV